MSSFIAALFSFLTRLSVLYGGDYDGLLVALSIKPGAYDFGGYNFNIYGFSVWLIVISLLS